MVMEGCHHWIRPHQLKNNSTRLLQHHGSTHNGLHALSCKADWLCAAGWQST